MKEFELVFSCCKFDELNQLPNSTELLQNYSLPNSNLSLCSYCCKNCDVIHQTILLTYSIIKYLDL